MKYIPALIISAALTFGFSNMAMAHCGSCGTGGKADTHEEHCKKQCKDSKDKDCQKKCVEKQKEDHKKKK